MDIRQGTEEFRGKRVLVAGLGISGAAAFEALVRAGARLAVYDDRDIVSDDPALYKKLIAAQADCFLGGADVPDENWDFMVTSPGVPPSVPAIERAYARGVKVIGELELAWRLGHGIFVAITGTNGKTTTTSLVGEMLKDAGLKTIVAGNIGIAVVLKAMDADDDTWLVTEVSSAQLETTEGFRPGIAALLNITPDHMDRHRTMENYSAAKARIFANQEADDVLVYNADDILASAMAETAKARRFPFSRVRALSEGAYVSGGQIVLAPGGGRGAIPVIGAGELLIPGAHNIENALAAVSVAFAAGLGPESIARTLKSFRGVEHRLEPVAEIEGVRFVNDSKGTNPDASIKAIEAVDSPILLIAGGYDKDADFSEYIQAAKGRVRKFLLLGATAEKIRDNALAEGVLAEDLIMAGDMDEAVRAGYGLAAAGDTVLLSPACASWDMYENFEERGAHFKAAVRRLGMSI